MQTNRKTQTAHFLWPCLLVAVIFFFIIIISSRCNIVMFSANKSPLCVIEVNLVGKSIFYSIPQEHVLQRTS